MIVGWTLLCALPPPAEALLMEMPVVALLVVAGLEAPLMPAAAPLAPKEIG